MTSQAVEVLYIQWNPGSTTTIGKVKHDTYDTINHTILIKKLEKYGIRGLPLQLLASYLTDRQQYTIVNQCKSKSRDVICGIPQGST